ncbi:MAG TPA: DMT family transporter [Acetobacteraceae bacterium]|nr:DMT family transporter [Acetobacteraceae bacterium]
MTARRATAGNDAGAAPGGRGSLAAEAIPLFGLAVLVVIWGLSVPAMKLGLESLPPFTLAALRYLIAAPCFVIFLIGRPLPPLRLLLAMIALGVIGVDLGQAMQILGVARTSAALATVVTATIPLFTVVLASLKLRQKLAPRHIAGLGVALAGVACAAFGRPDSFASAGLAGAALLLLCSVVIASYYVLGTVLAIRTTAIVAAAWTSLAAVPGLVLLAGLELLHTPFHPTLTGAMVALYLGLLTTVAGMWLWLTGMRRLPARIAASTQYLQPLVGVAASAVLFGDRIGLVFACGTALVLGGIALASLPAPRGTIQAR